MRYGRKSHSKKRRRRSSGSSRGFKKRGGFKQGRTRKKFYTVSRGGIRL